MRDGFIPADIYREIHRSIPIPCLDLAIVRDGRVLLVHRKGQPAKGQWWLPGGRIRRGESFEEAALRLSRAETGIEFTDVTPLGMGSLFFQEDPFGHGEGTHAVALVFLCRPEGDLVVTLDEHHDDFTWTNAQMEGLHPYVQKHLDLALRADQLPALREGSADHFHDAP